MNPNLLGQPVICGRIAIVTALVYPFFDHSLIRSIIHNPLLIQPVYRQRRIGPLDDPPVQGVVLVFADRRARRWRARRFRPTWLQAWWGVILGSWELAKVPRLSYLIDGLPGWDLWRCRFAGRLRSSCQCVSKKDNARFV